MFEECSFNLQISHSRKRNCLRPNSTARESVAEGSADTAASAAANSATADEGSGGRSAAALGGAAGYCY